MQRFRNPNFKSYEMHSLLSKLYYFHSLLLSAHSPHFCSSLTPTGHHHPAHANCPILPPGDLFKYHPLSSTLSTPNSCPDKAVFIQSRRLIRNKGKGIGINTSGHGHHRTNPISLRICRIVRNQKFKNPVSTIRTKLIKTLS